MEAAVLINFLGRVFFLAVLSWLVVSCAVNNGVGNYVPPQGSLQSLYPYQLNALPRTPIERVQIDSREKGGLGYVCFNGDVSMAFIDGVARLSYKNKKKWPNYGSLTRAVKMESAADGSINHILTFSIEAYKHQKRNDPRDVWGETVYQLTWNSAEETQKRFEAELEIRANIFYENGKPIKIDRVGKAGVILDCGLFPDEETLRKAMVVFALGTLTPEQQLVDQ